VIVLVAKLLAKPGQAETVAEAFREMAPLSMAEIGCFNYLVSQSVDNPNQFLVYEEYADEAALQLHKDSLHFKRVVEGRVLPHIEQRDRELFTRLA